MQAAILHALGRPLSIEEVHDPVGGTGEVVVDVAATAVVAYAAEVFSGARAYPIELPIVPGLGAVGRVRSVGPDATRLAVGDWVWCDPTVRSRDGGLVPDITLQGWSARGEGGLALQRYFHDGSFAGRMRLPTENAVPIGDIDPWAAGADAAAWCAMGLLLVPFGGWNAARLTAGETAVVSGATGSFGSAAVAVALGMGAGRVVATGRNTAALDDLARRFGDRVRTAVMRGDEAADRRAILDGAEGPIDLVLDILPPAATASQSRVALTTVRPYGRVVLMGGVGMLGGPDLELPYPWIMRNCVSVIGQWMYPVDAPGRLVGLIRAGLIDLADFAITSFGLSEANDAVAHAAATAGPFRMTVIRP